MFATNKVIYIITRCFDFMYKKIQQFRHIIASVLAITLILGVMDKIVVLIDKFLMPIFGHEANNWLSIFFLAFTIVVSYWIYTGWKKNKKVITEKEWAWLIFGEFVYWYFRVISPDYDFDTYWKSFIAYLDPIAVIIAVSAIWSFLYHKKVVSSISSNNDENNNVAFHRDDAIDCFDNDVFGLESQVNRILGYLKNTDVSKNAYSIGLVGRWGEGKTSLMNLVKSELSTNEFVFLDYNPRISKDANHIQSDFFKTLRQVLTPQIPGFDHIIAKYAEAINIVDDKLGILAQLLKQITAHKEEDVNQLREYIENAITTNGKKILVFIDDLDRLTGEELIEVMKLLARNGAFKNMFFITAFDKEYVNNAIRHYLSGDNSINYTDKYFNAEIPVPLHAPHRLRSLLEQMLKEECKKDIVNVSDDNITFTIASHANSISQRLKTVRDVKRFVNQLIYSYKPVADEVTLRDFFLLELIRFSCPEEYDNIHNKKYIHLVSSATSNGAVSENLWYLNDEFSRNVQQKENLNKTIAPASIDLIRDLFPDEADYPVWYPVREKRIYSISSFEYYFYNYEYAHLTAKEAVELLRMDLPVSFDELERLSNLYPKDVETALATKDVTDFDEAIAVKRYFHIIVSALIIKNTTLNYISPAFSFLRKEDVEKIIKIIGLKDKSEYVDWIKGALLELLEKSPKAVSNYTHHAIYSYHEGASMDGFYFTEKETLDITVSLFKAYLDKVDEKMWNVDQALSMSMVLNAENHIYKEVADLLRESVTAHFHKYSNKILYVGRGENAKASFNVFFRFNDVFPDKEVFEQLLYSKDNDTAEGINDLRAFWPIFKENGYKEFFLTIARDEDDVSEYGFESETEYLNLYHQYDKDIDALVNEWKKKPLYRLCDRMVLSFNNLKHQIEAIPLKIALAELYSIQIDDAISTIIRFKEHAADITHDIEEGDFVMFKPGSSKARDIELREMKNAFTFQTVSKEGYGKLSELFAEVPINQLQYIPIDSISDSMIYYDSLVAASVEKPDQPIPVHQTNYSYYMDSFANLNMGDKTYKQIVEEKEFQFVHEVQHWLKENEGVSCLKIKQITFEDIIR